MSDSIWRVGRTSAQRHFAWPERASETSHKFASGLRRRRRTRAILAAMLAGTACSVAAAQLAKVEVIDMSNIGGKNLRSPFVSLTRDGSAVIVRTQPPAGQGDSSFYRVPLANPSAATHLVTVPTPPSGYFSQPTSISDDGRFVTSLYRAEYWDRDRGFQNAMPGTPNCGSSGYVWVGATGTLVGQSVDRQIGQYCYSTARRGPAAGSSFSPLSNPLLSANLLSYSPPVVSPTGKYIAGLCEGEYLPSGYPTSRAIVRWDEVGGTVILPPGIHNDEPQPLIRPVAVSELGVVLGHRFLDSSFRSTCLWRWSNSGYNETARNDLYAWGVLGTSDDGGRFVFSATKLNDGSPDQIYLWDDGSDAGTLEDQLKQFCGVDTTTRNLIPAENLTDYNNYIDLQLPRRVSADGTVIVYANTDLNLVHVVLPRGGGTPGNQAQWANSNGGSWGNAANWVGASIANEDSIAVFDRASEYVVSLAQDRKAAGIQVKQGNVTLSSTPGVLLNIDHPSGQCGDFGDAVNVAAGASLSIDGLELFIDRDIEVKGQFRLQEQAKVSDLFASGTTHFFANPSSQVDLWTGSTLNVDNVSIAGSFSATGQSKLFANGEIWFLGTTTIDAQSEVLAKGPIYCFRSFDYIGPVISIRGILSSEVSVGFIALPSPAMVGTPTVRGGGRLEAPEVRVGGGARPISLALESDATLIATGKDSGRGLVLGTDSLGLELPADGAVTLQLGQLHLAPDESSPSATTRTVDLALNRPELGFTLDSSYGTPQITIAAGARASATLSLSNGTVIDATGASITAAAGEDSSAEILVTGSGTALRNLGTVTLGAAPTKSLNMELMIENQAVFSAEKMVLDVASDPPINNKVRVASNGQLRLIKPGAMPGTGGLVMTANSKVPLVLIGFGSMHTSAAEIRSELPGEPAVMVNPGSAWQNDGDLIVSSDSPNKLASIEIDEGTLTTDGTTRIGKGNGNGEVVLRGSGIRWTSTGSVYVGDNAGNAADMDGSVIKLLDGAQLECNLFILEKNALAPVIEPPRGLTDKAIIEVGGGFFPRGAAGDVDIRCATIGISGDFATQYAGTQVQFAPGAGIGGTGTFPQTFDASQGAFIPIGDAANAGTLRIEGSYTQDGSSLMQMGAGLFDGPCDGGDCVAHSRLDVRDLCVLGGGVRFVLATESDTPFEFCGRRCPLEPVWLIGRTIDIVTAQGVAGAFDRVEFGPGFPTNRVQFDYQADKVRVTFMPRCTADFNNDQFLTFEDFDAFIGAFESGDASSDFNADGFITFEDFDAFVGAFEIGC